MLSVLIIKTHCLGNPRYEDPIFISKMIQLGMLRLAQNIYSSALQVVKQSFGEYSLFTAKIYTYLGNFNTYHDNYIVILKLFFLF